MSWQQEYLARYEQRLQEKWTVDGKRRPVPFGGGKRRQQYKQLMQQMDAQTRASQSPNTGWGMPSDEYTKHIDNYNAEVYRNTREICGND